MVIQSLLLKSVKQIAITKSVAIKGVLRGVETTWKESLLEIIGFQLVSIKMSQTFFYWASASWAAH